MSSLSLARKKLVHGVHSEASGPVKGAWGEGHMNESGFLMIPHESKPGCYTPKAWVTDELPSDIDILICMRSIGEMRLDILEHSCAASGLIQEPKYVARKPEEEPTHEVIGNDGARHSARVATMAYVPPPDEG